MLMVVVLFQILPAPFVFSFVFFFSFGGWGGGLRVVNFYVFVLYISLYSVKGMELCTWKAKGLVGYGK